MLFLIILWINQYDEEQILKVIYEERNSFGVWILAHAFIPHKLSWAFLNK